MNLDAITTGDVSTIVGTWTNDLGESLTISANGQISNNVTGRTYLLSSNGVDGSVYFGTIYNPDSATDSAAFILIPAGVENPHIGGTISVDSIVMGHGVDADYHPYFKN